MNLGWLFGSKKRVNDPLIERALKSLKGPPVQNPENPREYLVYRDGELTWMRLSEEELKS